MGRPVRVGRCASSSIRVLGETGRAADVMELPGERAAAERFATKAQMLAIKQAFYDTRDGASSDLVVADPRRNQRFLRRCREHGLTLGDFDLNRLLFNARKRRLLSDVPETHRFTIPRLQRDDFEFACEIAIRHVQKLHGDASLDTIICDPALATEFDDAAGRLAPGYSPLWYRWVALGLRKARRLQRGVTTPEKPRFRMVGSIHALRPESVPEANGVYLLRCDRAAVYVGETLNLRHRLLLHKRSFDPTPPQWLYHCDSNVNVGIAELPGVSGAALKAAELAAIHALKPLFNYVEPERAAA